MPRRIIKRYLPEPEKIRKYRSMGIFGQIIFEPNLWHLNRRSFSGAFAVGLFSAMLPIPMQMLLSATGAIIFRVNMPLSIALVWLTNPVTMPPVFFAQYWMGSFVLGVPMQHVEFEMSLHWVKHELLLIWQPFLTGVFISAILSAIFGYIGARLFWRIWIVKHWRKRKLHRTNKPNQNGNPPQ